MENIYLFDIQKNKITEFNEIDEISDKLYFLQVRFITNEDLKAESDKKIIEKIKQFSTLDVYINLLKNTISKSEEKIPLYDAYTENIYLIKKHNVYSRVVHQYYRFPEKYLLDDILLTKNKYVQELSGLNDIDYTLTMRKIKKIDLLLNFMNCFDLETLFNSYVKVFYKYSSFVGKETTVCKNPSFLPQFFHVKPYLSRNEVINSALNFGFKLSTDYIEPDEVNKICKNISIRQLDSKILLKHQNHILNSGSLGLVQYYTLQGSFFMNQYLRNFTDYASKNHYLEELIEPMWNLVLTSPKFDKSYTFYRFVSRDDYLQHLKIGDYYTENGFMSTTRDPFYKADQYKFGFILIKIKVPENIKGVALCLETISHFPEEQEIIFPPKATFKLISKDVDCLYYHTDINFSSKVKTRYEFEWIDNKNVLFERDDKINIPTNNLNFLKLEKTRSITLIEKIKFFDSTFVNKMGLFNVNIGDKTFNVLTEWYDSTGPYKDFYALEIKNGYAMYSIYKGYILFYIELGETTEGKQMHVNYFVKYSSIDSSKLVGNDNLIKFFSSVANYFDISNAMLYANYINCGISVIQSGGNLKQRGLASQIGQTNQANNKFLPKENSDEKYNVMGGSYCSDMYQYLKTGIKKYSEDNILNVELKPIFSYHDLNYLKKISPEKVLDKNDKDELYQLYFKYYKTTENEDSLSGFYLWLISENKCYLMDAFIQKIDKIFGSNKNPFKNDVYILDASTYLYNRKEISTYPTNISIIPTTIKRETIKDSKFHTRQTENKN